MYNIHINIHMFIERDFRYYIYQNIISMQGIAQNIMTNISNFKVKKMRLMTHYRTPEEIHGVGIKQTNCRTHI